MRTFDAAARLIGAALMQLAKVAWHNQPSAPLNRSTFMRSKESFGQFVVDTPAGGRILDRSNLEERRPRRRSAPFRDPETHRRPPPPFDLVGVTLAWNATTRLPTRVVLKASRVGFGREELPFYQTIARRLTCPAVPQYFAGGTDELTGRTWLLMEDLSDPHERPSEAPLPPTFARGTQLVEALAQFHAAGWNSAAWENTGPTLWQRLQSSEWLEPASARLFNQAGDALDSRTRGIYAQLLSDFPTVVERSEQLQGKTLVHGDAHVWNWMLPRNATLDMPKLIDWDGWHVGVGVWDLAYMMAPHWDCEVRQRFEIQLLDRYYGALVASGVRGYSREALQEDYRLAVPLHLRTPIARFSRKISAYVWWPQLVRIQHAVEDLRCIEMLN
ncbi:phosphotransferase family protein [Variovorax sp.]|uniref:phosphotransferase family protein n=1 Tax=Variovorax sp. TaxID=1871043 RepID=UPI003BA94761